MLTRERFGAQPAWDGFTHTRGVPDAPAGATRTHRTAFAYDPLGRVFGERVFSVTPSGPGAGTVSAAALETRSWFDRRGNEVKRLEPGGLVTKRAYDGAGRLTSTTLGDGGGDVSWSDALIHTGDVVLEEHYHAYDDNGNVVLTTTKQRHHDAAGFGPLGGAGGGTDSGVRARVGRTAFYYDGADRPVARARHGVVRDPAWTRDPAVPAASDDVLVTTMEYGWGGAEENSLSHHARPDGTWPGTTVDTFRPAYVLTTGPRGVQTREKFDGFGRRSELIENFLSVDPWATLGTPALRAASHNGVSQPDANRATAWEYNGLGRVTKQHAYSGPETADVQTTAWQFGSRGTGGNFMQPTDGSEVWRNDVVAAVAYPLSQNGETYAYGAHGAKLAMQDRNGTGHAYAYDDLGRLVSDDVTFPQVAAAVTPGGVFVHVDDVVDRLAWSYDDAGRPASATSLDASHDASRGDGVTRPARAEPRVVNEVRRTYNGLGQVVRERQSHDGPVTAATPFVGYAYGEMAGGNHSRPVSVTYPSGWVSGYDYGGGGGGADGVDDGVSRLSGITETRGGMQAPLESLDYLGLDTLVGRRCGESLGGKGRFVSRSG